MDLHDLGPAAPTARSVSGRTASCHTFVHLSAERVITSGSCGQAASPRRLTRGPVLRAPFGAHRAQSERAQMAKQARAVTTARPLHSQHLIASREAVLLRAPTSRATCRTRRIPSPPVRVEGDPQLAEDAGPKVSWRTQQVLRSYSCRSRGSDESAVLHSCVAGACSFFDKITQATGSVT